jgi:hypothetical protein
VASAFTPVRRTLETVVESRLGWKSAAPAAASPDPQDEHELLAELQARLCELEARLDRPASGIAAIPASAGARLGAALRPAVRSAGGGLHGLRRPT